MATGYRGAVSASAWHERRKTQNLRRGDSLNVRSCNLRSSTAVFEKKLTVVWLRCNTQQSTRQQRSYLFKYSTYRMFVHLKDFQVQDCKINPEDTPVRSVLKYIRFLRRNRVRKADSFRTAACQVLGSGKRTEIEESTK